jgi:hypothetical protein
MGCSIQTQRSQKSFYGELRGAVKKFPEFFDIISLVDHEFVAPGQCVTGHFYVQVLQMQFGESGATSGRQGLLLHDNAPTHASLVLSSPSHRALRISLGLGTRLAFMEDIKSNVTPQKKPFASASNNGRIDGPSVCVCVMVLVRR